MSIKQIKTLLLSEIRKVANNASEYCLHPGYDFTRNRKLPLETILRSVIGMDSKSLTNELIDLFQAQPDMPTASAFSQQRCKLKPEAFKAVLDGFSDGLRKNFSDELPIFAIDGSDIQIPTDPQDEASYFPGSNGQKGYNLLHLNAMYDLSHHIYSDAIIQKRLAFNEHKALQEMVDRSTLHKALVIAGRGYESYNNMAHIQEKGWFFLIRIKDGKTGIKDGFELPDLDAFDIHISLALTRKQTKETKELFKDRNHYKFIPANTTFDYLAVKNRKHEPTKFYK